VRVWFAENEQGSLIEFREMKDLAGGISVNRPYHEVHVRDECALRPAAAPSRSTSLGR